LYMMFTSGFRWIDRVSVYPSCLISNIFTEYRLWKLVSQLIYQNDLFWKFVMYFAL